MTRALLSALLLLFTLTGCEQIVGTPKAVGEIPEILVVADSTTWAGPVGEAIRAELAQPIVTLPNNQGAFKLTHRVLTPKTYESIQRARHVILAAPIDEDSRVGEFMRDRIDAGSQESIRAGRAVGINLRPNLWSLNQLVVIATAADGQALTTAILRRGPELRAAYNELAYVATEREMFDDGRQVFEEDSLAGRYDWSIGIQHDYVLAHDSLLTVGDRTGQFVRYRRILSDTWRDFFVFVQDDVSDIPSQAQLDELTDDLLEVFARGVLDSSFVQTDATRPIRRDSLTIAGHPAVEQRGLWYMTNDIMGGSYIRQAFVDPETDRLFVYYGMVFAPNRRYDKREFIRQMEVIGRSIEPNPAPAAAAP